MENKPDPNLIYPSGQSSPPAAPEQPPPNKTIGHLIMAGLGFLIFLAIILPNSSFAQALEFPIVALGAIAAIKFFVDSIRWKGSKNPLLRAFVIMSSLGVAWVIFSVCFVIGAIVGFSKDPNPQSTG